MMKTRFYIILAISIVCLKPLKAQKENYNSFDSINNYNLSYTKYNIPKKIRKHFNLHLFNTTNSSGKVKIYSCNGNINIINNGKLNRINWIGTYKTNKNFIIISISKGGKGISTLYFIINIEDDDIKIEQIKTNLKGNHHLFNTNLSFQNFMNEIKISNYQITYNKTIR